MLQGFEDAFTDAQARTISLALELLENNKKEADMILFIFIKVIRRFFLTHFLLKIRKSTF